jgi:DNA replication and repair protein RecF
VPRALVHRVRTLGFRNLADGNTELGEGVSLVWGANAAGKTNLLEAVYLALAGRSPRTRNEREAIAFGHSLARVKADVADSPSEGSTPPEQRTFLCAIERGGERRHQIDGHPLGPDGGEQRPSLSVFIPDRLVLVKGAPAVRRGHLDRLCAALWPSRTEARRRYARGLAQRNALLGRIRAGQADAGTLDAWDAELAGAGAELIAIRAAAVDALAEPFATAASELGLEGGCRIAYRPRSEASTAAELADELGERRDSDVGRGFTTHGPHLDEVAITRGDRALRRYGSQGEQRLALLALLFAERDVLLAEGRPPPLMLLDDVTSELDLERRGLLCERLVAGGGQALITATEPGQLPAECPRVELSMREGRTITSVAAEAAEAA